jgi:hypothetical protein
MSKAQRAKSLNLTNNLAISIYSEAEIQCEYCHTGGQFQLRIIKWSCEGRGSAPAIAIRDRPMRLRLKALRLRAPFWSSACLLSAVCASSATMMASINSHLRVGELSNCASGEAQHQERQTE